MENIVAVQQINRALRPKLRSAVVNDVSNGDEVLAYRKKKKRWVGTFTMKRIEGKRAFISDNTFVRPFHISQVLPSTARKARR